MNRWRAVRGEALVLAGLVLLHGLLLRVVADQRVLEQMLGGGRGVRPDVAAAALGFAVVRCLVLLLAPGLGARVVWRLLVPDHPRP